VVNRILTLKETWREILQ